MAISDPDRPSRPRLALAAVIAIAGVLAVLQVDAAGPTATEAPRATSPMVQVAPGGTVELAALPPDHQVLYRAADGDPEAFRAVACYCGCESFLDHRHLGDCFVRPDGAWERHATGCAICLAQARDVIDMRAGQVPLDEIVRRIDATYGGTTTVPSA